MFAIKNMKIICQISKKAFHIINNLLVLQLHISINVTNY